MKNRKHESPLYLGVILLLALVMIGSLARIVHYAMWGGGTEAQVESKIVTKDGVSYFPRQDITVVMVSGIDQSGKAEPSGSYNNHGSADMIMLLVLDDANKKYDVLYLNRDTMVTMPRLGIGGKPAGTDYRQLALAHTTGSGMKDSSQNLRNTVSDFLLGTQIDYYMTMRMDAVAILADAVGGVTVNVEEDFSAVDPTIQIGTMKLTGEQALNYVRTRKDVGDQLNLSRINRQEKFIDGFAQAMRDRTGSDAMFFASTLESVQDYVVTDCTTTTMNELYQRFSDYEAGQVYKLEGKNEIVGENYGFFPDKEKLEDMTLQLFFAPIK